jgi:hypothetical protein
VLLPKCQPLEDLTSFGCGIHNNGCPNGGRLTCQSELPVDFWIGLEYIGNCVGKRQNVSQQGFASKNRGNDNLLVRWRMVAAAIQLRSNGSNAFGLMNSPHFFVGVPKRFFLSLDSSKAALVEKFVAKKTHKKHSTCFLNELIFFKK